MTDRTDKGTFRQGHSGNPKGRPKGSRHRLGEEFVSALADDFQQHGAEAIDLLRTRMAGSSTH